jgi:hypothetical protein
MGSTSPLAAAPSTGIEAEFSQREYQLRLPLYREVGRNGLFLKNSTFTDGIRRLATKRLPLGAPERMAALLGCRAGRIYDEHAGEIRYSLDVFVADLLHLPRHEGRRALRPICRAIGALVIEDPRVDEWTELSGGSR